jgi:fatty acid desaturase
MIHFLANFQHILFIPIVFFAARIGIVVDSTLTERKFRPWTILGNVFHILLHYAVLSQTSTPMRVYMVAACQFAVLSLQLLGNHHIKPWNHISSASEGNFCVWQILCTQDFHTPVWFRWFYGGLNFHYSHHLFPTVSREYFSITTPHIRRLCEKHGLPFIEVGFVECVTGMVTNMIEVKKEFAKHALLEPFTRGAKRRKSTVYVTPART